MQTPTDRELDVLKILWERGEATVREVYEDIREDVPIVQNTVQALLRTMEQKGLVKHRVDGRAFLYKPCTSRDRTTRNMLHRMLDAAFDGAVDQLVDSLFSLRKPSSEELNRLAKLVAEYKANQRRAKP